MTNEDPTIALPRAETLSRLQPVTDSRWGVRGILAVAAVLALCAIADGAILMLLAVTT